MERDERLLGTVLIFIGTALGLVSVLGVTDDEALSLLLGATSWLCLFHGAGLWIFSRI